jgi:CPA2 family monovalent cation:H+ antiporter-2
MNSDAYITIFVVICLIVLAIGTLLKILKQPVVIGYIIVGLLIGPYMLGLVTNTDMINTLGNIGVILLLFFIGMSLDINAIKNQWKKAIIGIIVQIILSVGVMYILGYFLNWPIEVIILLGFVITHSSTAVILKILEKHNLNETQLGKDVISLGIMQDLAVIPMIMILNFMINKTQTSVTQKIIDMGLEFIGLAIVMVFLYWMINKRTKNNELWNLIEEDKELQIFFAFALCFGFGLITGLFKVSFAIGAFLAGIFISSNKEKHWITENLLPFKNLLVAFFFLSIGMLINTEFLIANLEEVIETVIVIFIINSVANALIFKYFGHDWKGSLYGGALHAHIGEFGFVLATFGSQNNIIDGYGYQMTVLVIAITMLFSPIWFMLSAHIVEKYPKIKFAKFKIRKTTHE